MVKLEERKCLRCRESKPFTKEFFRRRGGKAGDKLRGVCKECMCKAEREANKTEYRKAYRKNYYNEHHEEILRKKGIYYQEKKEEIYYRQYVLKREHTLARKREYHIRNADKEREYRKEYYSRPEVIEREKQRRINEAEKNKEYQRQYIKTERGRALSRIKIAKRRALKEKTIATFTPEQWEEAKVFFNYECAYCGVKPKKFDEEHVIPLSEGGPYTKQNIIPACETCNGSKWKRDMHEWYKSQPFFSEQRLKKIYKWIGFNPKTNTQQLSIF